MGWLGIDWQDPETRERIRGGLLGFGQAITQPNSNLGSAFVAGGLGERAGSQKFKTDQMDNMTLATTRLGLQEKLGSVNFLNQLLGKQNLTMEDLLAGKTTGTGRQVASLPPVSAPFGTPAPTPTKPQPAPDPNYLDKFYAGFVAPHEGGRSTNPANRSNFGIDATAHPEVDINTLTPEKAKEIIFKDHINPSGAATMHGPLAAIQADTAINFGVSAAKQMLDQSGGDPQKYLELRRQKYEAIAANNPEKRQFLNGWRKRNDDLAQYVAQNGGMLPQSEATGVPTQLASADPSSLGIGSDGVPSVSAPQQQPAASSIIPPDLQASPMFRAALQAGDSATVMKMLSSHQTRLTPQELEAEGLPHDTVAYRSPDNSLNIERPSQLKPQEVIDQEMSINRAEAKAKQDAIIEAIGGPESLAVLAGPIAKYQSPMNTTGRSAVLNSLIMQEVLKQNPDYRAQNFNTSNKTQAAFGTGKQGDTVRSLNVSISHLQTLRELGAALQNGDVNVINAARQKFAEQFGVPAPTNFDTAKSIVADEVAKGVIGGQSAQSDRETLAASLRRERSPQAINGAINTFQELLAGQMRGLKEQFVGNIFMPQKLAEDMFNAKLLPETRTVLEKTRASHEGGGGGQAKPKVIKASDKDWQETALKHHMTVPQAKELARKSGYQVQ